MAIKRLVADWTSRLRNDNRSAVLTYLNRLETRLFFIFFLQKMQMSARPADFTRRPRLSLLFFYLFNLILFFYFFGPAMKRDDEADSFQVGHLK